MFLIAAFTHAQSHTLMWEESLDPDVAGYRLYFFDSENRMYPPLDVGLTTSHSLTNLHSELHYLIYITAVRLDGVESEPSTVIQFPDSEDCYVFMNPTVASASPWQQIGGFRLISSSNCGWTAQSSEPWIIITTSIHGSGLTDVWYRLLENETPSYREGRITILGRSFTIGQFATGSGPYINTPMVSSVSVLEGQELRLNVVATEESELRYQWLFYGNVIPGATNDLYVVPHAARPDVGSYTVAVSSAARTVYDGPVEVTVYLKPQIRDQPENTVATVGQSALFYVVATGPDLHYEWRKNGNRVGSDSPILEFPEAQESDFGAYQVTIYNNIGSIQSDVVYLSPNDPVRVLGQINIQSHQTAALKIEANGIPGEKYEIQVSTDLARWLTVATHTVDFAGRFTIEAPNPVVHGQWFVRTVRRRALSSLFE
jgi:hypothetical protein